MVDKFTEWTSQDVKRVDNVSKLVTPNVTRAGTASGLIQKDIQDMITIRQVGTYV